MKRVIRKGVFETNSSSTHSITIRKVCKCKDEIDDDASFEIRSPVAKIVQILGLINRAESDFKITANEIDYIYKGNPDSEEIKNKILTQLNDKSLNIDTKAVSSYDFALLISNSENIDAIDMDFLEQFDDELLSCFYFTDLSTRKQVLRFKDILLDEYCKLESITPEQAMERIDFEAFGNVEIRNILKDEATAKEKLEAMEYNFKFKQEFEESGSVDIVAFAKEYLIKDAKEFKEMVNGKISCELYFSNGCLNDCYCGFEDYFGIAQGLKIGFFATDDELHTLAKDFLSPKYKIVCEERYAGCCFEQTGEIF